MCVKSKACSEGTRRVGIARLIARRRLVLQAACSVGIASQNTKACRAGAQRTRLETCLRSRPRPASAALHVPRRACPCLGYEAVRCLHLRRLAFLRDCLAHQCRHHFTFLTPGCTPSCCWFLSLSPQCSHRVCGRTASMHWVLDHVARQ